MVAICSVNGTGDFKMKIQVLFCLNIINLALKRKPAGNFEKRIRCLKFASIIVLLTTIFMKRLTNFISSLCRNEVAILCGALTLLLAGGATIPASGQSPDGETVVSGKVTSKATKDPLAGVVIYIEGTSFNTTTDSEGNYSFSFVPKEGTQIMFYFLGMEDYSVAYTGQKTIDVTLQEASESLDDVVVTGYGNIRKEGFTGNTTRISKDEILKVSPKNVISAIQVFDPSFRITENIEMGSNPNALPEFTLRGQTSITLDATGDISRQNLTNNNNLPIFILDGFEVDVEKIYDMDPSRINSITLLKDAAATALYGSRAANGVIVIESRAPEAGKIRVQYNFTSSLETPDLSDYNLMNAREKLEAEVAAGYYDIDDDPTDNNIGAETNYRNYIAKLNNVNRGVDTDWLAMAVRNAFHHQHSLYIDGGVDDIRWGAELRYGNEDGVMHGTNRETYGAGITLDYRVGKFQVLNRTYLDVMASNDTPYQDFSSYSHLQPYSIFKDAETGRYLSEIPSYGGTTQVNPLYEDRYMLSYNKSSYNNFSNQLQLNFFATNSLTAKLQFSINKKYSKTNLFIDPASTAFAGITDPSRRGTLDTTDGENFSYNLNAQLLYNKNIKKNYINVTAVAELSETSSELLTASYTGFSNGTASSVNNAMTIQDKPYRTAQKYRNASAFILANYSYDDIYLLDASFRIEGSSEFGADYKAAPFWSAGAGINIHNYAFLKDNKVISTLKLRATYGQVGNVNYPVEAARTLYQSTSSENWYITGIGNVIYALGNSDLRWEKTNSFDAGFDLGMFNNRFYLKFSYYDKTTDGMITTVSLPSASGFDSYYANIGRVKNYGYEIDLRYNFFKTKDWDLTVFANMSHLKNRILEISDALRTYNNQVDQLYADYNSSQNYKDTKYSRTYTKYVEGGSMTSIFAVQSLGINPANGQELFLRPDGTVTYDWNAADQVIVGNTEPYAQGSFGLNLRWKNFSIFTSFLYRWGGQQYNQTLINYVENVDLMSTNADKRAYLMRWKQPGDVTSLKSIADGVYVTRPTSRFVQNDNILQFNSLSLSYDFNPNLIKKAGMGMLRLTASMEDVAHWSSIRQERGLAYPYSHIFNFTINVTF